MVTEASASLFTGARTAAGGRRPTAAMLARELQRGPTLNEDTAGKIQLDAIGHEARDLFGAAPVAILRLTHSRVTRGVWRVTAGSGSTAVVKVLVPPAPGDSVAAWPASMRYWLREARLYAAGIPGPYRVAGVRGPELLGHFDRPDGDVALWLEDVPGVPAAEWDLPAFARAARRLGRAQGAYLAGAALPADEWMSRGFLRQYLAARRPQDDALLASDAAWRRPVIARHFSADLRDGLRRLRADRARLLGWLESAPRTFAHLDVWPDNLFDHGGRGNGDDGGRDELILIDWGFAGIGGAGEDAGNLVPDSVFDLRHPPAILRDLDRTVSDAYLGGLRDAGWSGDERIVRLGMCASACKYDWIAGAALARAASGEGLSGGEGASGGADGPTEPASQPIYGDVEIESERFFGARAAVLGLLVEWAAEARALAVALGLD